MIFVNTVPASDPTLASSRKRILDCPSCHVCKSTHESEIHDVSPVES